MIYLIEGEDIGCDIYVIKKYSCDMTNYLSTLIFLRCEYLQIEESDLKYYCLEDGLSTYGLYYFSKKEILYCDVIIMGSGL